MVARETPKLRIRLLTGSRRPAATGPAGPGPGSAVAAGRCVDRAAGPPAGRPPPARASAPVRSQPTRRRSRPASGRSGSSSRCPPATSAAAPRARSASRSCESPRTATDPTGPAHDDHGVAGADVVQQLGQTRPVLADPRQLVSESLLTAGGGEGVPLRQQRLVICADSRVPDCCHPGSVAEVGRFALLRHPELRTYLSYESSR